MGMGIGIIGWIIIGGIAGWIASKIMGTDAEQGVPLNIAVGVVGALLGGWLLSLFGVDTKGSGILFSLLTSVIGACVLLFLVGLVTGRRRP